MKILIVEDEMIISEDIAMILEGQDYEVTDQVTNFEDALSSLTRNLPDLALLDINLASQKSGIDIGQAIKEIFDIPFIYTSSLGSPKVIEAAKATNPAAYLIKPFREEQLLAAIEVAMENFANSNTKDSENESIAMFNNSIFIKENHRFVKLLVADIAFIKKSDNYLEIHTKTARHLVRGSLTGFLEKLSFDKMFRAHKSFAINLESVQEITPQYVTVNDIEIPLSKSYSGNLKKHFRLF